MYIQKYISTASVVHNDKHTYNIPLYIFSPAWNNFCMCATISYLKSKTSWNIKKLHLQKLIWTRSPRSIFLVFTTYWKQFRCTNPDNIHSSENTSLVDLFSTFFFLSSSSTEQKKCRKKCKKTRMSQNKKSFPKKQGEREKKMRDFFSSGRVWCCSLVVHIYLHTSRYKKHEEWYHDIRLCFFCIKYRVLPYPKKIYNNCT